MAPLPESQVVVVDPCFLNELRDLPDEHLSFVGAVEQVISLSPKLAAPSSDLEPGRRCSLRGPS